jgi:CheY-like chemotaxis protein
MAGGIAHDFNNQLAVVLGNLELALQDLPSAESELRTSIINAIRAAEKSAELSGQMLIYSGSAVYLPKDVNLDDLLYKTKSLLQSSISKHVAIDFDICKTLPPIEGEPNQIQRLIYNLVVNAAEAIGDNAGDVTLRTGVMDCDEAYLNHSRLEKKPESGRFVFLEVADTGCGMDAETQRKLFDPFFTTKFWGRGLGMAEVMGIIKGHHGAIMVNSEDGKGTIVRVLFPAPQQVQASTVQVMEAVETQPAVSASPAGRKTILVVDDEELVRRLVTRRLEVLGYLTITASDGEEGVRVFRDRQNEIDLVILDFAMPKMNGVEAFGELIRFKQDVKVILSSGYTEEVVLQSFPGQRPAGVLHKPYKMEELKGELDRLLGTTDSGVSKDVI